MKSLRRLFSTRRNSKQNRPLRPARRFQRFQSLESREMLAADTLPVLMVIADDRDFYYQEYGDTRAGIEAEGVEVQVAASSLSPSTPHANTGQGASSGVVTPDLTLADVDVDDYSAIVFVGGWGSSMYQYAFPGDYSNNHYDGDLDTKQLANDLINEFTAQDKFVTAICHGVTVLAWARVDGVSPLEGKQISIPYIGSPAVLYEGAWYNNYQLGQYEQATANGAIANTISGQYGDPNTVDDDVVVDGRIITAENYDAALAFGHRVAIEVMAALPLPEDPAPEDPAPEDPAPEDPAPEDPPANQAPEALDAAWNVDENSAAGTVVGVVSATDPDAGQSLSFAISGGNSNNAFAIDTATGQITVANADALDFETNLEFQLMVEVTDDGENPLTDSALITVSLQDLPEAPISGVSQVGNDLVVQGTDGADTIYIWSGAADNQVFVWMNGVSYGQTFLADGGRVVVHGSDGNDRIYATDARTAVAIYGEEGHDRITGGSANDFLSGGDGVDVIRGNAGDDFIRGDGGDDYLYGQAGNDLIVGGDGNDRIEGNDGQDILLGGLGSDYLKGDGGEDLVVGGTTSYDNDPDSLAAVWAAWSSPGLFEDRANQLATGIGLGILFSTSQTVQDDDASDIICGGSAADLIFAGLGDRLYTDADDLTM